MTHRLGIVGCNRRVGQHQRPAGGSVAERGERQHAGLRGGDRHAAESGGRGVGLGVRTGPAIRDVDAALQAEVFSQNATVAGLQTRQTALQAIDAVQGTPGQNTDIASLIGNLQNQFSTLLNDPSSQAQQSQVVSAATTLAQGINTLSDAYTSQRQTAQDNIVAEVSTLNSTLGTIGRFSDQIVELKAERPEHRRSGEPA